jgi:hypothetical protein
MHPFWGMNVKFLDLDTPVDTPTPNTLKTQLQWAPFPTGVESMISCNKLSTLEWPQFQTLLVDQQSLGIIRLRSQSLNTHSPLEQLVGPDILKVDPQFYGIIPTTIPNGKFCLYQIFLGYLSVTAVRRQPHLISYDGPASAKRILESNSA